MNFVDGSLASRLGSTAATTRVQAGYRRTSLTTVAETLAMVSVDVHELTAILVLNERKGTTHAAVR